ncbi:DNA-binding protein [Variovorax boronicumulans]|uniref:DNA-binding protein n=1 Tax=Variovorax boronicumulans TaxID=436515 RepID=UPI0009EDE4D1|nr:DNA-binding protein [Variovorax boronicumulans]
MIAGLSAAERIEATTVLLAAFAVAEDVTVTADMRVSEKDAADLLGYAPGHLKNLRQEGRGPVSYQRGVGGSRVSYRLTDLSAWIEAGREGAGNDI